MGFNTENRTILSVFQKSSVYIVPRYQRAYVWKETNWSELLTDINFLVDNENLNWSHFLGAIVLSNADKKLGKSKDPGINYFEIIDGQQRITTIFVILSTISRRLIEIKTEESNKRAKYLHDTYMTSMKSDSERLPKIDNKDLHNNILELIDYSKDIETEKLNTDNHLYKVFKYYYTFISKKNFEELDIFLNKLLEINLVEIISEEEEEIYNIFEVLNARGQKLKQMELLKNHIMKYVHPREDLFIDKSKTTWNSIIKRTEVLSDIDILMNHFAKCYIKKRAENANSVYKLIKEEIDISSLNKLLKDLDEFSIEYIKVNENDSEDSTIEYFNVKRNQQIRSLLTAILLLNKREIITEKTKNKSFLNIRNFFFIFNGMQKTSNKTDKIIGDTSYLVYYADTETEFKMIMTDFFIKLNKFLNETDFISIMKSHPSFRYSNKDSSLRRNGKLVKYTLVEYAKDKQHDTKLVSKELSIEHLINDDGSADNSFIGNLTLANPKVNSDILANKSIQDKISILKRKSTIRINEELEGYLVQDSSSIDIIKRGEELILDLYNNIFSFEPYLFNINDQEVLEFMKLKELLSDEKALLNLLKQKGKNFKSTLEKNPSMKDLRIRYQIITK